MKPLILYPLLSLACLTLTANEAAQKDDLRFNKERLDGVIPSEASEQASPQDKTTHMSIYDFSAETQDGRMIPLSEYKGKVLLIVNTATHCGFTPQYNALQDLYAEHQKDGLVILDFPCNQFGSQAPGSNEEIHNFCTLRYKITFPQFAKIDVNGKNAAPLYQYLTSQTASAESGEAAAPNTHGKIKWNFTKFLINREGQIVARFEPSTKMQEVKLRTLQLLFPTNP